MSSRFKLGRDNPTGPPRPTARPQASQPPLPKLKRPAPPNRADAWHGPGASGPPAHLPLTVARALGLPGLPRQRVARLDARAAAAAAVVALAYPTLEAVVARFQSEALPSPLVRYAIKSLVTANIRFEALAPQLAGRSIMRPQTPMQQAQLQSIGKELLQSLIALVPRPVSETKLACRGGAERIYRQAFGHVARGPDGAFVSTFGQTLSSDAIKYETKAPNTYMRHYNANLGSVVAGGDLILVRSARTDSSQRLDELLVFGAAQAGPGQLHPIEGSSLRTYRPVIISAMDLSPRKALATRLQKVTTGHGEVETRFLQDQSAAIQHLFADKPFVLRNIDGRLIRIERPVRLNLPFSAQAQNARNVALSRRHNAAGAHVLFAALVQRWQQAAPDSAERQLAAQMGLCNSDRDRQTWLRHSLPLALVARLSPQGRQALTFLRLTLAGYDLHGRRQVDRLASGRDLLHLRQLLRTCGMVPHVQCKSGQDRTLSMLSTWIMADMFEHRHGVAFAGLKKRGQQNAWSWARRLFSRVAEDFGEDPIKLTRGDKGKVKWALAKRTAHPWAQALYTGTTNRLGQARKIVGRP